MDEDVVAVAARDPVLAAAVARWGVPPRWPREPGFVTLVHLVLEQQLSLDAARAHLEALRRACGGALTPASVLALDDATLRGAGVSRQKTRYLRDLAGRVTTGRLDLPGLADLPDDAARAGLTAVLGIGAWTADCYLLFALDRPDVLPAGDLALQEAVRELDGAATRPGPAALVRRAEPWRPHRSAASRILWHHYLSVRGRA
ncbi:MAG: DNA-3-methyladenine glycosylase 2 family protein [Actinobacteria bacterium]|nr:DNA-3-methyladenine glycosylase 2 family protein [Actinomycetota bacterium]